MRRGRKDPAQQHLLDGSVWRASWFPAGPATYHLVQRGPREISCRAWGAGAEQAVAAVPDLLGARDDPTGFAPQHPLLVELHRRHPGLRIPRTGRVIESLVPAVLEQRVPGITAFGAWRWLLTRHGEVAPGPAPAGMRVPPTARGWGEIPVWDWHRAGVDPGRARTIRSCVRVAGRLEECAAMPAAQAQQRLRIIPGVGVWTAAEVTARAIGDADALSVGDYHLSTVIGTALLGMPLDDDAMVELLEPMRPHRYRVVRLLELHGFGGVQRRGPRITLQDHRSH
jgi:3-methyladenine DNA glycosylase/8-oxoguanine DNA glycosylase